MSMALPIQLQLADPGWLRIDEATVHVSGSIEAIVVEMAAVLSDATVRMLCSNLGILSTGFYFIDPIKKYTRFFTNDPRSQPQTYRTEYLWSDQEAGQRWSDIVHRLFVQVRTLQSEGSKDNDVQKQDFFRHIPKENWPGYCVGEADREFRLRYALHYVTLGEMLFTMLAWHSLVVAVNRGQAACKLEQLNVGLLDDHKEPACEWCGIDLLGYNRPSDAACDAGAVHILWKQLTNDTPHLASVWERLGVRCDPEENPTLNFQAVVQFAASLQPVGDVVVNPNRKALNRTIQQCVPMFLQLLGVSQVKTIGNALRALERYARFPILPFYVWHALDRAPKCYLVTPVWTSQQFSVKVDDAQCPQCRHLGLALSAVLPLRRIDWTLPQPFDLSSAFCSEADPVVISNVIRLMARPLVEEHLYGSLLREMNARDQKEVNDVVKRATEEIMKRNDEQSAPKER